ncbi:hypothetical protein ECMP0209401_3189 [Escherichia coli MP020940.1]|nr:hypothetical protein L282_0818 [Escherichia coli APEC IMT5155]AVN09380.1 hypothetical protein CSC11_4179 [Escherichia coli]EIO46578.1 hypothetical protein ECTW06591_4983 [Escherichia coli TW06591]EJL17719.1 hypothetical protein SF660363_0311 [Shigella flexneri 6603-63]EKI06578.1 hypothetical protein EC5412_5335 [Escherichia coli 5412]EKI07017.1 hypothetical protein ECEC96038_3383 [Escherichia coli EC96038]EKI43608.1 hypothetical protein EC07798_1563 [Escherichia coli 07798]EKK62671.1 hypo
MLKSTSEYPTSFHAPACTHDMTGTNVICLLVIETSGFFVMFVVWCS